MAKPDTSAYATFDQITGRLDQIIGQVRDKDTSLERSLDLFDEAIALGSKAVYLVDSTNLTPEEETQLAAGEAASGERGDGSATGGAEAKAEAPVEGSR